MKKKKKKKKKKKSKKKSKSKNDVYGGNGIFFRGGFFPVNKRNLDNDKEEEDEYLKNNPIHSTHSIFVSQNSPILFVSIDPGNSTHKCMFCENINGENFYFRFFRKADLVNEIDTNQFQICNFKNSRNFSVNFFDDKNFVVKDGGSDIKRYIFQPISSEKECSEELITFPLIIGQRGKAFQNYFVLDKEKIVNIKDIFCQMNNRIITKLLKEVRYKPNMFPERKNLFINFCVPDELKSNNMNYFLSYLNNHFPFGFVNLMHESEAIMNIIRARGFISKVEFHVIVELGSTTTSASIYKKYMKNVCGINIKQMDFVENFTEEYIGANDIEKVMLLEILNGRGLERSAKKWKKIKTSSEICSIMNWGREELIENIERCKLLKEAFYDGELKFSEEEFKIPKELKPRIKEDVEDEFDLANFFKSNIPVNFSKNLELYLRENEIDGEIEELSVKLKYFQFLDTTMFWRRKVLLLINKCFEFIEEIASRTAKSIFLHMSGNASQDRVLNNAIIDIFDENPLTEYFGKIVTYYHNKNIAHSALVASKEQFRLIKLQEESLYNSSKSMLTIYKSVYLNEPIHCNKSNRFALKILRKGKRNTVIGKFLEVKLNELGYSDKETWCEIDSSFYQFQTIPLEIYQGCLLDNARNFHLKTNNWVWIPVHCAVLNKKTFENNEIGLKKSPTSNYFNGKKLKNSVIVSLCYLVCDLLRITVQSNQKRIVYYIKPLLFPTEIRDEYRRGKFLEIKKKESNDFCVVNFNKISFIEKYSPIFMNRLFKTKEVCVFLNEKINEKIKKDLEKSELEEENKKINEDFEIFEMGIESNDMNPVLEDTRKRRKRKRIEKKKSNKKRKLEYFDFGNFPRNFNIDGVTIKMFDLFDQKYPFQKNSMHKLDLNNILE